MWVEVVCQSSKDYGEDTKGYQGFFVWCFVYENP